MGSIPGFTSDWEASIGPRSVSARPASAASLVAAGAGSNFSGVDGIGVDFRDRSLGSGMNTTAAPRTMRPMAAKSEAVHSTVDTAAVETARCVALRFRRSGTSESAAVKQLGSAATSPAASNTSHETRFCRSIGLETMSIGVIRLVIHIPQSV